MSAQPFANWTMTSFFSSLVLFVLYLGLESGVIGGNGNGDYRKMSWGRIVSMFEISKFVRGEALIHGGDVRVWGIVCRFGGME